MKESAGKTAAEASHGEIREADHRADSIEAEACGSTAQPVKGDDIQVDEHNEDVQQGTSGADAQPGACDGAEQHSCCFCRHKNTERSEAFQADIQKRLNRAIGQLNGVKAMVEDNRYCGDVLTQLAAAESAIHRTAEIILQDHMETCVVEQVRAGNVEVVDEAMKLIRRFMR